MVIALDGLVVFADRLGVYSAAVLLDDPALELHVGRLAGFYVIYDLLPIQVQIGDGHLIEAVSAFVIALGQHAGARKGKLGPQPWQVDGAEGSCGVRADERNNAR